MKEKNQFLTNIIQKIRESSSSTSGGASGISYGMLKRVTSYPAFMETLKNLYETLLNNPDTIIQIPELYEFVPLFFDKLNGSLRPIAM